jgi:hypothetical protein
MDTAQHREEAALAAFDTLFQQLLGRLQGREQASERDAPIVPLLQSVLSNANAVKSLHLAGVRWALIANARAALEAAADAMYFATYQPRIKATARCWVFEIFEFALMIDNMDVDSEGTEADVAAALAEAQKGPLGKAAATDAYDPEFAEAIRNAVRDLDETFRKYHRKHRHVPHWSTLSYYKRAEVVGAALGGESTTRNLRITYSLLSRGVHARMRTQERNGIDGLDPVSILGGAIFALQLAIAAFDTCPLRLKPV